MRLSASDIHDLYRPSPCNLRTYLIKHGERALGQPDALGLLLRKLGRHHEQQQLSQYPSHADLSNGDLSSRQQQTLIAIRERKAILSQPVLLASLPDQDKTPVMGIPDILIREQDEYIIRDFKLALSTDAINHPDTLRQLELYGWIYEQNFGHPPLRLEIVLGDGSIKEVPYDGGERALKALEKIKRLALLGKEPYEPVGWSKCNRCDFFARCWPAAERRKDVALIIGVDQALAHHFHRAGIQTFQHLAAQFTVDDLAKVEWAEGSRTKVVGNRSKSILLHAHAMSSGTAIQLNQFPHSLNHNYAVFDLEGLPNGFGGPQRVYLWGIKVYGLQQSDYYSSVTPLGETEDLNGWNQFLANVKLIFERYGEIPFVHYANYEKTMLSQYIQRFGDCNGIAKRVLGHLLDLHALVKQTVVLPDPSYSLKVVERRAGFQRTMNEYGGSWSIAQYIKANESDNKDVYDEMVGEIQKYNREDLEATWAVFYWLAKNYSDNIPNQVIDTQITKPVDR